VRGADREAGVEPGALLLKRGFKKVKKVKKVKKGIEGLCLLFFIRLSLHKAPLSSPITPNKNKEKRKREDRKRVFVWVTPGRKRQQEHGN
jgi:hypothetical protein